MSNRPVRNMVHIVIDLGTDDEDKCEVLRVFQSELDAYRYAQRLKRTSRIRYYRVVHRDVFGHEGVEL